MARQRLGQHFLADEGWREQIARAIRVSPHGMQGNAVAEEREYCWIEVGAGHGEMTEHLLQSGKPVFAVELDAPLIGNLQRMAKLQPNLTVVPGDVLETDLGQLAAGRRIRIYGNLPYYITSPILHHFFSFASLIDEIFIVIQLEVAERLVARPDTSKLYGYLSVATQFYSRPELLLRLPRGAFQSSAGSGLGVGAAAIAGRRRHGEDGESGRFSGICETLLRTETQNLGEQSAGVGKAGAVSWVVA